MGCLALVSPCVAGSDQANTARAHLRLIDFGSAVDEYAAEHLYGEDGPSAQEQTAEYAPPEATFASYWHGGRTVIAFALALAYNPPHPLPCPPPRYSPHYSSTLHSLFPRHIRLHTVIEYVISV